MSRSLIVFLLFVLALSGHAQELKQTVRGRILDEASNSPLIGATVVLLNVEPVIGTVTETDGSFRLNNVPVGRQALKVSFLGYHDKVVPNLLVTTGKELVLDLTLQEKVLAVGEVVVTGSRSEIKGNLNNDMTTVSARSFDLEETSRYAGSRNDPARMAANFAGVSGTNDSRNDIIIRGNSPIGLLWRLEGTDIPNPSHFGSLGSTGGPVSMLNNNVLAKSDFMTSAFPAEYGNATSGVFDLRMRNGNNQKREYLGQVGFNGFELGAEGPFSKNSKASYLVNYRYTVTGVFQKLGIDIGTGTAVPKYQDLTLKVNLPTEKAGTFTLFGIGGKSSIDLVDDGKDSTGFYGDQGVNTYFASDMGVIGIANEYFFSPNTSSRLGISISGAINRIKEDSLSTLNRTPATRYTNTSGQGTIRLAYTLNHKFNARNSLRTGFTTDRLGFNYDEEVLRGSNFESIRDSRGSSYLYQSFVQWQHRFNDRLLLTSGVRYLFFELNKSQAVEPRLGVRWAASPRHAFSLGAGVHNQIQMLPIYFIRDRETQALTNKNLDFTRSRQLVLGYELVLNPNTRLKAETYYQHISQAPVDPFASAFSMMNAGADFSLPERDSLVNKGSGRNYGLELTLERFYTDGYYFLVTASLFESKYKGSDGIERNTAFNGNYIFNALGGKEFRLNRKHTLSFDMKLTQAGGRRFTPVLLEASQQQQETVYDETRVFSSRYDAYFRADAKVTLRQNGEKVTQEWSVDVQNVTNRENIFRQYFDKTSGTMKTEYQLGLFPNVQYRILF